MSAPVFRPNEEKSPYTLTSVEIGLQCPVQSATSGCKTSVPARNWTVPRRGVVPRNAGLRLCQSSLFPVLHCKTIVAHRVLQPLVGRTRVYFGRDITRLKVVQPALRGPTEMPPKDPIYSRVLVEQNQGHDIRRFLFRRLEQHLGRPVVSFFSNMFYGVLSNADADMLQSILQEMDLSKGFALVINSPGGDGIAAERIINVCRTYSGTGE